MRFLRAVGLILIIVMLVATVGLFFMRMDAAKAADKDALAAAMATPAPTPVPESTPVPTAEPTVTPEPVPTPTEEPTPSPVPTPDPDSPAGRAAALGLPAPPDIDIDSWEYQLVNADHSIGQYVPEQLAYLDLTVAQTDIQYTYNGNRCAVDARIAQPLLDMALACKQSGLSVFLSSGYRSYNEQVANFQRICNANGTTTGKNYQGYYITMPAGCSEHQLAMCCDITDRYYQTKNDELAKLPTVQWLAQHCAEYGFILRFPIDKRDITQVMYESWHFRYVGKEAAAYIMENGLCLEEFVSLYRNL